MEWQGGAKLLAQALGSAPSGGAVCDELPASWASGTLRIGPTRKQIHDHRKEVAKEREGPAGFHEQRWAESERDGHTEACGHWRSQEF